uniref:LRRNT domain-containing protein n=1 Tax=Pelodiscus sinensis TaxID=13735 RepID=K7F7A6_PELSI
MSVREPPPASLGSWGLLLLSLLLAQLACQACPVPCECSEPARTVKCVLKELSAVPAEIPRYTRNLFITGNQITRINSQDFRGLPNLVTLSLASNRISSVASQAFSALPSLRYLDLSNNCLVTIHPDAFSSRNNSIRELNLSRSLYNSSAIWPVAAPAVKGAGPEPEQAWVARGCSRGGQRWAGPQCSARCPRLSVDGPGPVAR